MEHDSLAAIEEKKLAQQLLSRPADRSMLLNIARIPNDACVFLEIPLQDAPGQVKGDIDLLVCAPGRAGAAIAIQVKRIKVGSNAFHSGKPNKLEKIKEGVWQTNDLTRIGFSQVYLYLLVSVDSRERNAGQLSYAGMTPELRTTIAQTIAERINDLDRRAGLVLFDFVQPMDYAPLDGSWWGGTELRRLAQEVAQSSDVTAWVSQVMQGPAF